MFGDTIALAVGGARTLARVDELAKTVWQAFASGAVDEAEAARLAEMVEGQRRAIRPRDVVAVRAPAVPRTGSIFGPKRPSPVSPDRQASMARRRRLAASGPMPPALAAGFTTGELAALRIVGDEVRARGICGAFLGEIAARAGVSVSTARNAIRQAARTGLLTVEERRREGRKNDSNLVRIVSREWLLWIARGAAVRLKSEINPNLDRSQGGGCKNLQPTDRGFIYSGNIGDGPSKKAWRRGSERLVRTRLPGRKDTGSK